jgi:acyl-CoA synthetase (AMP-forming)/AMP-acid ligase II
VAVYLENSLTAVISMFAVAEAGGCFVLVNPATTAPRLGYIIENCSPRFLIFPTSKASIVAEAEQHCSFSPVHIVTGKGVRSDGEIGFDELMRGSASEVIPVAAAQDIAGIIYTSGSTGKPKGVTHTHRSIDTVVDAVSRYLEHSSDDIILDFLPLSIGYGLLQLCVTFRSGGTLILEKGFGYPYDIINRICEEKVTGFAAVPTVFSILVQLENVGPDKLSTLRYMTNAAAALPQAFIPKLKRMFPSAKLYLMYGLTECFRASYLPPDLIDEKPASVGRGMPHVEVWIEDGFGGRVSCGTTGELMVKGSNIMKGYWNDPEGTAQVIRGGQTTEERVLRTGDLFRMDEEGYLYFVGRMDDIIKTRGKKVSPLEIEETIYLRDEVLEARVIGVPDDVLGSALKAEIVLKKGAVLSEEQLRAHCRKVLEEYQVPKVVEFVPSLPKSAGGKILRVN